MNTVAKRRPGSCEPTPNPNSDHQHHTKSPVGSSEPVRAHSPNSGPAREHRRSRALFALVVSIVTLVAALLRIVEFIWTFLLA